MAATVLTVAAVSRAGIDIAGTAATVTDGDAFPNTGKEVVLVNNGSGAPITVTLKFGTLGKVDGQTATERTVTVAAGVTKAIGPFTAKEYNDANNRVTVICSAVTTVTVKAISVTPV